ncbi:MAG: hypothetical protein C4560_02205 [Nitrospiraceae bacterium]|nr:MAG: hypothetical protein C4560_02205 [Nitrospiraceae bacterium]
MSVSKAIFCALVFMLCAGFHAGAVNQAICRPGSNVELYPGGSLKSCVLNDYFRVDGIECNKQSPINFYEDGLIESCILSKDTSISGQKCKQLAPIYFYATGEFKSCVKQE